MSLIRRNEMYPVWSTFFNNILNRDWNDWQIKNFSDTNTTLPSVNIKEGEDNYEVEMAAPGLEKRDFKLELKNGVLTISSQKRVKDELKKGHHFTRREYSYQSFNRSFSLPDTVEGEKIAAKYEDGILRVVIPKREELKERTARIIDIK
jgi:HSP20 family protein